MIHRVPSREGKRRDDPLLAERGGVPRPVTRRFRRDRIQSCQAIVCGEPDEPILILVEIMGDGDSSACLIGRSVLLEAPRQRIVQVERVVSTDPYPARAVPRQGLTNDEPDALRILAIRKGTPALGRGTIDAKESVVIMKDGNGKVGKFFREVASRNAVALIKDPPTENANCVTTV